MTRGWISVVPFVVACGGATPPPAEPQPPPAQPIPDLATLDGDWRAEDLDGWVYELTLGAGKYQQTIRRTTGGPCTQKGTIDTFEKQFGQPYVSPEQQRWMYEQGGATYGGAPPGPPAGTVLALVLTLEENTCNPDYYQGTQLVVIAQDFDASNVTLRLGVGFGGAEESHRYARHVPPPVSPE